MRSSLGSHPVWEIPKLKLLFHQLGPLGQVNLIVTKSFSVLLSVCLSPSHAIFLRGRTGAERSSSVDLCDLDLDIDLE